MKHTTLSIIVAVDDGEQQECEHENAHWYVPTYILTRN